MRGKARPQTDMAFLVNLEELVERDHPLREVKRMCQEVLESLEGELAQMYAPKGRPSVPPERLLMAWVLMCLYGVRSCRRFAADLRYNLLYKWFLDMNPDETAFDHSSFSQNMERFEKHRVSELVFAEVVELARRRGWISDEHFSVDGTLIEAWASLKSFRPKDEPPPPPGGDRNDWVDFKAQKRSKQTHASTTDPQARLARKGFGKEARLCFGMHAVGENRSGLLVKLDVQAACGEGNSEAEVASKQLDGLAMLGFGVRSVGADKGYHTREFVQGCRDRGIAPHVACVRGRKTPGLDGRTTRSKAYRTSQRIRKRIEEPFGWMKTAGHFRKTRWRGIDRTHFMAQFFGSACNLLRMAKMAATENVKPPGTVVAA